MNISKSAGYAVHGLGYLIMHEREGIPVHIKDIALHQDVPKTYLAKIFQQLVTAGIVHSQRGVSGGYSLAKQPVAITLLDIVEAVDGPILSRHCCLGIFGCQLKPSCAVLEVFVEANNRFADYLRSVTLEDVIQRMTTAGVHFYDAGMEKVVKR